MRIGLVVLVCATVAWLLWPRAEDPGRDPTPRSAPEPANTVATEPADDAGEAPASRPTVGDLLAVLESDPDSSAAARALHALIERGPAAVDAVPALIRYLRGDATLDALVFQVFAAIGPAARDAVPAITESFRAFEHRREDYERRHRGRHVSWAHLGSYAGDALVAIGPESVPTLIELLGDELQRVRWTAARALEEFGAAAVPHLELACRSPNPRRREEAVGVFGKLGGPATLGVVSALLDDPERDVRAAATRALGAFGAPAAPHVARMLGSGEFATVAAAADAARASSEAARRIVPVLAGALGHRMSSVRIDVAKALARIGADARPALAALVARLGDPNRFAGDAVVDALVGIGAPAVKCLEDALHSDDPAVRRRATDALSRLGPAGEAMIPVYDAQLDSDDADERVAAAIALARHGARAGRALPHLQRFLEGDAYTRHEEALRAIVNYRDDAAAAIAVLLRAADAERARFAREPRWKLGQADACDDTRKALVALGRHDPAALVRGLHDRSAHARDAAEVAIAAVGPHAVPWLVAATRHEEAATRAAALRLLGPLAKEDEQAIAAITAGLRDPAWSARASAAAAHWRALGDTAAVPVLIEALGEAPQSGPAFPMDPELSRLTASLRRVGKAAAFAADELEALRARTGNWQVRAAVDALLRTIER